MPKPTSDCRATERKHPWPMVRLGELGMMVRGNGIKRCETIETGCPCLRYGEIYTSFNVILDKPRSFVPKELFDKSVKIKKGDLVFTLTGENTEEIAKSLAYLGDGEIAAGGDLAVWTGHGCDSKYLAYLMYSPQLISQKAATGNGNIVVHTSIKKLQQLEIPLPPLPVQREIVARLERELAAVEKMKKGFEALAETAKAEFKAELKEVFEEIKRGGAETRRLGEVCELIKDGEHKTPRRVESYCGYYLLSARNVKDDNLALEDVDYVDKEEFDRIAKRCRPIAGDVLISCSGSVGRVCVADEAAYVMVRSAAMVRASRFDSRFLMFMLQSDWLQKQIAKLQRQAAQANLFLGAIAELNVYVPPLAAQREVVTRLDFVKARAEKLEAKAREGVAVCETMRKAILKEAFE